MAAIHVREVDDFIVDALKERAARNQRSLQGEIRHILETAVAEERSWGGLRGRRKLRIRKVAIGGPVYTRETIYE